MTTIVDLTHASCSMSAVSSFSFAARAYVSMVAVSTMAITSSVLTGGVLQRDGIMQATAVSSMTAAASVKQGASASMLAESSMTVNAGDGVISYLEALTGMSGDYPYSSASVSLEPLTSSGMGAVPAPYYAYASSELAPLMSDAYMLTGHIGQADVSLRPLTGLSGDYPYGGSYLPPGLQPGGDGSFVLGEAGSYLAPLTAYGYDPGQPETGPGGITIHTAYMSEILFVSDTIGSSGSEFNAEMNSSLQASSTMDRTKLVDADISSTANVDDSIGPSVIYTVEYMDTLGVSSSLGGNETYVAWVVNANTRAPSMYENFEFDSLITFNGRHLAAGPNGICELTGDDDNGVEILARVRMAKTDFSDPMQKRMGDAYFGVQTDGAMTVKFITDDGQEHTYFMEASDNLQTRRVKPGKGLRSRYWQVEISNPDGTKFTLESDELMPIKLMRRL